MDDWMQDTIDAGFERAEQLQAAADSNERLGGDFTQEALQDIQDGDIIEDELLGNLPGNTLTRLAIMAAYPDTYRDYLGPYYNESQGAIDAAEFRLQFEAALADEVERRKQLWIRRQAA